MKCEIENCADEEIRFNVYQIHRRRILTQKQFCQSHGRRFLEEYLTQEVNKVGQKENGIDPIEFDIALIADNQSYDEFPGVVILNEVGGSRRRLVLITAWAFEQLFLALMNATTPYVRTHLAWLEMIQSLNGVVDSVLIDSGEDKFWSAKVQFSDALQPRSVDLRPSDAFVLAIVSGAPIFLKGP